MEAAQHGWILTLVSLAISLPTYQFIIRSMWKKYQEAQKKIESTNIKLQETNYKLARSLEEFDTVNKNP